MCSVDVPLRAEKIKTFKIARSARIARLDSGDDFDYGFPVQPWPAVTHYSRR